MGAATGLGVHQLAVVRAGIQVKESSGRCVEEESEKDNFIRYLMNHHFLL